MKKLVLIISFVCMNVAATFAAIPVIKSNVDTTTAYVSKADEVMVNNALKAFKNLSRAERKAKLSEAKILLKDYKASKAAGSAPADSNTVLLAILAVLLPPLAVYLHENAINGKFWLSLLLTLLFVLPGIIYALIVVLS